MSPKQIVITGVARGLGRAMCDEFIRRGHVVWGCSRSPSALEELASAYGSPHRFDAVDVSDVAAVDAWAKKLLPAGTPDLVLNNAALINRSAPAWEITPDEFSQLIDVNIKGVFHVMQAFLPAMIAAGSGVLVNFSSGWGRSTSPEVAPYCATKWAIEGLTQAVAQELPAGLAAVPLNPGIIHTAMLDNCFGADAAAYPKPSKWAKKAVPFLLELGPRDNGRSLTAPG